MDRKNLITTILVLILLFTVGILAYGAFFTEREEVIEKEQDVIIEPERQNISVVVFFNKEGETECDKVFPTRREIESTIQIGSAALKELLKGPTLEEKQKGYITNIPEETQLNKLTIENGTAIADFSEELNLAAGSCRVQAIRAQITMTLMQFSTVEDVIITIEGTEEGILQP